MLFRSIRETSPRDVSGTRIQTEQQQCPSPPLSATTASPASTRSDLKSLPDTIERLALELSRSNLQLDRANLEQLQAQLSSPALSPQVPCMSPTPPCPDLEMDDEPQLFPTSPVEVYVDKTPFVTDMKRLRRQESSHYNNDPNNSRSIQTLVQGMIESGTQCNVHHRASPPAITPTSPTRLDTILEPDADMALEVDEAYVNASTSDAEREEVLLLETMVSLRRAGAPAGIRKMGLLHYRASADAALNCANVVRSRPRMRRRHKLQQGGEASSIVSSAFSSPVIPPSLPDDSVLPFRRV